MPITATPTELYSAAHVYVDRRLVGSKPIVEAALDGNRAALRALMGTAFMAGHKAEFSADVVATSNMSRAA